MSNSHQNFNLNEQIYENTDKSIKIFKTRLSSSIKYIAVKVYSKKNLRNKYSYEYDTIHNIKGEGILNIISSTEDSNFFYMVEEFCATGDLSRCLWNNKNNRYLERTIKSIGIQLLSGLQTLHKNGIIHCNLKPSNIVIDEYGNVKICDFKKCLKLSKMTNDLIQKNKCAMTPCYTAPELFRKDGKYSFKSDLWALGCILFELAVGQVPFFDNSIDNLINKIIKEEVNFERKELTNYSDNFIDVIKKLLIKEPNERITWGEIERMSWWDGYFYSNNNESDLSKMNTTQASNKSNTNTIDTAKLSKIAIRNKREQKEDYNNTKDKDDKIGSTEEELDFQSNDTEDLEENSTPLIKNSLGPFPMNISVLSISKAFKRDRRTYDEINSELIISAEEDIPKLENLILHTSDRIIKPIIGNKAIEENQEISYNKKNLSFTPWRKDILKEMMGNNSEIKNVENYLYNIYFSMEQNFKKKDFDNLYNLLKYFETLVTDREIANNLINTSFIELFITFLSQIKKEEILTICCCIIGYMVRYATIISSPLDKYGFCEIICKTIKESKDNSHLIKKATATLGEYLFYVGTQEEAPDNTEWTINKKYLDILLYCLDKKRDEVVKFYAVKTIENLCILTNVSKNYFAKNEDFFNKILLIYTSNNNSELKYSAISTISHILRHNSNFLQIFLSKIPLLTNRNILLGENDNIKQCLINCLLFSINNDGKIIPFLLNQENKLIEILLILLDKSNNVLKVKIIFLIGLLMINPNMIIQYGEETFIKLQKLRNDKNREIHQSVRFAEKSLSQNAPIFIHAFSNALTKNGKLTEINKYCETFDIIGIYHKISYNFFTPQLLYDIKDYLSKLINTKSEKLDSNLIGILLDVIIKFSENPISVEQNVDVILRGLLIEILKLTPKIKGDNSSKIILITANVLTIILSDEKLYSIDGKEGKKNNEIRNLIKKLIPLFGTLIQDKDLTEEILSLLSLIVERDENYITLYQNSGVIDYIFDIMPKKEFYDNLNILKILIILMESKDFLFKDIIDMNFIERINILIERTVKNYNTTGNNNEENEEETSYINYVFELLYEMVMKLMDYKKEKFPKILSNNMDMYKKEFSSKVEAIAKNFNLFKKMMGYQNNVNLQEISCMCLIFILNIFPGKKIESINLELKFKGSDIPNLLKGLELSCYRIHKKMIHIFKWIIQFQEDANKIFRPYLSYLITYLENICNTSADPSVISTAQNFMENEIKKLKK